MSKAVASTLEEALNLLIERGWSRDRSIDGKGQVCIETAVKMSSPSNSLFANGIMALVKQLPRKYRKAPFPLRAFNDDPEVEFDSVIILFENAIERETYGFFGVFVRHARAL